MVFAAFIMAYVTISKGLKHVGIDLTDQQGVLLCIAIAVSVGIIGKIAINMVKIDPEADKEMHFTNVEKIFGILMIFTACCMAFAHGSNDVANAIGPLAAVVGVIQSGGQVLDKVSLDFRRYSQ